MPEYNDPKTKRISDKRPRIMYAHEINADGHRPRRMRVGLEIDVPEHQVPAVDPARPAPRHSPKKHSAPPLPSFADESDNPFGPIGWLLFICFVVGTAWGVVAVMTRFCESLPGVLLKSL